jgi:hypothetical protein
MTRTLRRGSLLVVLIAAAGCSATAVPIHGSDGKPYLYVDCSGMFRTLDDCYRAANEVCPDGYRIVNSVAPRANPFGNLVIGCQSASGAAAPAPSPAAGDAR